MPIKQVITEGERPVKVWTDELDPGARAQLVNLSKLPFIHRHVAAMPDVHGGIGATIGSVIATHKAIIPAAVGVDIGCGMAAVRTSLTAEQLDERVLKKVFDQISRDVPVGRNQHKDERALTEVARPFDAQLTAMTQKHPQLLKAFGRFSNWVNQMGTLGGGNHFIEVCLDESGQVWVMLHSGSRGIGNAIGHYFIELARRDMERWFILFPGGQRALRRLCGGGFLGPVLCAGEPRPDDDPGAGGTRPPPAGL
jgi:tRNA-splicing ligase RtcB (3'-phosphate/5'-hydroxy nucleic acid ligase)